MAEHNTGFINHACVAFTKDASRFTGIEYTKSRLERIGETLVWHVSYLPRAITTFFSDPKVATVALTALAMFTVQFCFYPTITYLWVKDVVVFLSHYIQPWAVKFAFYIATQAAVLGIGVRALGRFTNQTSWKSGMANKNRTELQRLYSNLTGYKYDRSQPVASRTGQKLSDH